MDLAYTPLAAFTCGFAGPFNGGMFLIVVGAKSKWIEVIPMSSTSASSTITALRVRNTWIA